MLVFNKVKAKSASRLLVNAESMDGHGCLAGRDAQTDV
jgi:hypothetical protein